MTILPQPKKLKKTGGVVSIARFGIVLSMNCDSRIFKIAQKLADEMYCETGVYPRISKALCPKAEGNIVVDCLGKKSEGYKLSASETGIKILGDSLAGAYYGIQTLRQMLESCGEDIECCEISDTPDMKYRGFYHDASRGRVPTVDGCKKLIDFLAYYKHNSYQIYIEHTFDFDEYKGIYKAFGYMTPEEIMEIDDYCYENFIDFVPSLSTFGHLFRVLESKKYQHLCELDTYVPRNNPWANSMAHHTINASDPESIELICSVIDQYVPLFRSKYFNICCDETFDLCNGKNAGKDKGALYLEFTMKIIDHLKSLGKTVMMWGDVVLHHPETMERFPDDMIMLNWAYAAKPPVENIDIFAKQRFSQVVCPGTSCWNQFVENVGYAEQNISAMVGKGGEHKVFGMLNTSWGDYGSMCPMTCTLYGVVLGAVLAWNHKTKVMCEKYDKAVSESVYGDPTGETVKLIREIGKCEDVLTWGSYVNTIADDNYWYDVDPNSLPKTGDPYWKNAAKCFEIAEKLRRLPTQSDIINDLRVQAEGLGFINEMMARKLDNIEEPEDGRIEDWCERYAESWLRDDKLAELDFILTKMRGKSFTTKALLSRD
ncbi:MAG: family 20 glycosylhydrolase [Clostridiales bacterium]|nr:family 20 glycosylhydrolase [Candidatus Coliplasma equi]